MKPLWPQLTSLRNLFDAANRAAEGKKSRPDGAFRANLEPELYRLQHQLVDGSIVRAPTTPSASSTPSPA